MTQLFILLIQSVTGAVLTIIALILVAALIGYFTAWYYAKSVYTPIIKGLEEDKAKLISEVEGLNADVRKLREKSADLEAKVKKLEEEIAVKDKELSQLIKARD